MASTSAFRCAVAVVLLGASALAAGCRTVETAKAKTTLEQQVTQTSLQEPAAKPKLHNPLVPSNYRNWAPDQAVLAWAEDDGERVTVHNVRNCTYLADRDYIVNYEDRTYNLRDIESVDFLLVPFADTPSIAHTMLSFGFGGGRFLTVSVEARFEDGEQYQFLLGAARQFEIMYVVADERDLIRLRTRHRQADVFLYRARATPEQARELFVGVMRRVNKLANEPEFYDLLSNNCTTNVVRHVNDIHPGRIPPSLKVLLPGLSDKLAYDLGLLDTDLPFDETKRRARINDLAAQFYDAPDFSTRIRQRKP